jgi:hypothetical protein
MSVDGHHGDDLVMRRAWVDMESNKAFNVVNVLLDAKDLVLLAAAAAAAPEIGGIAAGTLFVANAIRQAVGLEDDLAVVANDHGFHIARLPEPVKTVMDVLNFVHGFAEAKKMFSESMEAAAKGKVEPKLIVEHVVAPTSIGVNTTNVIADTERMLREMKQDLAPGEGKAAQTNEARSQEVRQSSARPADTPLACEPPAQRTSEPAQKTSEPSAPTEKGRGAGELPFSDSVTPIDRQNHAHSEPGATRDAALTQPSQPAAAPPGSAVAQGPGFSQLQPTLQPGNNGSTADPYSAQGLAASLGLNLSPNPSPGLSASPTSPANPQQQAPANGQNSQAPSEAPQNSSQNASNGAGQPDPYSAAGLMATLDVQPAPPAVQQPAPAVQQVMAPVM